MTRWLSWLREAGRFTSFLVFQILILFWCVNAGYAAYGYFSKGGPGARQALLRHMSNPYDPSPTSTVFRVGSFVFYDLGFFSSLPALTCHDLRSCITSAVMPSVA